jgi:hypothetical protein
MERTKMIANLMDCECGHTLDRHNVNGGACSVCMPCQHFVLDANGRKREHEAYLRAMRGE